MQIKRRYYWALMDKSISENTHIFTKNPLIGQDQDVVRNPCIPGFVKMRFGELGKSKVVIPRKRASYSAGTILERSEG
jgi:hypothetical protein